MPDFLFFSSTLMSCSILFLAAYIVLSSAKFASSSSLITKDKSFIKIVNKIGPNIDPCGIPSKSIWKTHLVLFIFTPCFLRFKYEYTKATVSYDKQYEWSFATSKSLEIHSKVIANPEICNSSNKRPSRVAIVPTKFLLFRDFLPVFYKS